MGGVRGFVACEFFDKGFDEGEEPCVADAGARGGGSVDEMPLACWFELFVIGGREKKRRGNVGRNKGRKRNRTDQIDMRIFDNHINVFGSRNAPILIVSITQVNANLE